VTSAPPDAPPAPDATGPAVERRRLAVAAAVVVLLVVGGALLVRLTPLGAVVGVEAPCVVLAGDRDVRPPAVVSDAAARVREVASDAATLTVTCSLVEAAEPDDFGQTDPADDPAAWSVGVDAQVTELEALPVAADAVLAAAPADAVFAWRLEVHDSARTTAVVLTPGGGRDLVDHAVELRRDAGVAEVWFGPDTGRLVVPTRDALATAVAATAGRDLPVTTVETLDDWLEVEQVHPGTWPDTDAVALAVDVAGWDGVWRVVLRGGEPASPDLTVEADDDAQRAHVASRLAATVHPGPLLAYHVVSQQVAVDGVVGVPAVADVQPDAAAPGAAGAADAAGVPACAGAELRVEVLGNDAAAGTRFLFLRATHTGAAPCVVQGVPALAFARQSGTTTPDVTQLPDLVAPDVPPVVVLAPGEAVEAQVRWAAMSTSQDPDVAVAVSVRPVAGGPAVDLVLPRSLDVLAGATVKVGPWQAPFVEVGEF